MQERTAGEIGISAGLDASAILLSQRYSEQGSGAYCEDEALPGEAILVESA